MTRALAVITANACGSEIEFLKIRGAMAKGNFEKQGEDLTALLIAKTQWLTAGPGAAGSSCGAFRRVYHRPKNPDGTWQGDTTTFWAGVLGDWASAPATAACSTNTVSQDSTKVRVMSTVTPACMRQQINEAIQAMRKTGQMGTDGLICGPDELLVGAVTRQSTKRKGDWDVNVRELVRLLYMGGGVAGRGSPVLDQSTIDHLYNELLSARGPVGDDSYSLVTDCDNPAGEELGSPEDTADRRAWHREVWAALGDFFKWLAETILIKVPAILSTNFVGAMAAPFLLVTGEPMIPPHLDVEVPETENHRLMIETSRFLTNADIIRRLKLTGHDNVDDLEEEQAEVRDWLLESLNQIARHDFTEYNSRPYTRYSLEAVGNLFDFAGDPALRTASHIVLDLSQAKFAAGSNRARRAPPFRRLARYDGRIVSNPMNPFADFYNAVEGSDHEVARSLVLAGQVQLFYANRIPLAGINSQIYAAVGTYRPPLPVLEVAIGRPRMTQQFVHWTIERYFQTPAFTVSAGGLRAPPTGELLGRSNSEDRGVAMPAMIIPTIRGWSHREVFMLQGLGEGELRTENLCVHQGFACGLEPHLPAMYDRCIYLPDGPPPSTGSVVFYSSARCFRESGAHFYLAVRTEDCDGRFCSAGRRWALMDIKEAPVPADTSAADPVFATFRTERHAALRASTPDASGAGVYPTSGGDVIGYRIRNDGPVILSVNGQPFSPRMRTEGDLVTDEGNGRITIDSPTSPAQVRIDVSDPHNPRRDE